jgi:hypothetical protein
VLRGQVAREASFFFKRVVSFQNKKKEPMREVHIAGLLGQILYTHKTVATFSQTRTQDDEPFFFD